MLNKFFFTIFIVAVAIGAMPIHPAKAASTTVVALGTIEPGDLIRGQAFSAVYYYGSDGFRYVFPNDKTYFTWYTDFDDVKWVSDADLGKLQIGGNVTYKPGVKMIKINTDPKVYAVDRGGSLIAVGSEAIAEELFGASWNTHIDDVPDGFFSNYEVSDDELTVSADVTAYENSLITYDGFDINDDRGLTAFTQINMTDNAYSDIEVTIEPGDVVRFVNNGSNKHTATADDLDWGSGTVSAGGGFWQRRFSEAGTYTYFCSYHPSMTGTIIVE
ncbi:MAG: plastocyanin/azurin family copper-binding protein [Patescibacteria group bacterium]